MPANIQRNFINMSSTYIDRDAEGTYFNTQERTLTFTNDQAMQYFIAAMKDGQNALIDAIASGSIFEEIVAGDLDAAVAVINDYLASEVALLIWGETEFIAADYGGEVLLDVLAELSNFLRVFASTMTPEKKADLARTFAERKERTAKALKDFEQIIQDPAKKAAWLAKRAAIRAVRGTTAGGNPTKPGDVPDPIWSITTQNNITFETLTFVGELPFTMPDTYTLIEQPDRSFTVGGETLSWTTSDLAFLDYGNDGYCVTWKTENGHSFAVNIWIPLHVFGIGPDAYYQVWYDGWGPRPDNWLTPPGGPGAPYTFPGGWGYTVNVVPQVGEGGKLSVVVTVEKETVPVKPFPCALLPVDVEHEA